MTDDDQKLGPPPVEPMSDVTWARVERGLWSRIDSGATDALPAAPRRRWLWLAVPALAAAAIVALLLGTGVLGSRDAMPVVAAGDPPEVSRVVTGVAPSAVSFGDAHIDLAAQSAIVLTREGSSPSVLLERGVATFAVAPRANRPPFVVRAGDTIVRVIGTKFSVARSDEQITVAVEHGLVDVQFRGTTQRVGAGQTWSSEAPTQVAAIAPAVAPAVAPAPDVDSPSPAVGSKVPTVGAKIPTTTDPDGAKYDRLTALERRDSKAALAGYLELSRGNTKWSAVALYAAGRLAADLDDRRAATFLDIYLRRFPTGANAEDARNLLARLKGDAP